jgi:hypothetical protein
MKRGIALLALVPALSMSLMADEVIGHWSVQREFAASLRDSFHQ